MARRLVGPEQVLVTQLGNAGSVRYALTQAANREQLDEVVYFVEDDYVHDLRCAQALQTPVAD
jgi:hypothetical protein